MSYWLMKSEPETYSISDLKRDGRTGWSGVRNFAARNHMRAMKKGDLAFFYHSSAVPPGVAGIMEVSREAYPDPSQFAQGDSREPRATQEKPVWFEVEVSFVKELPRLIAAAELKAVPALKGMTLFKQGRLSVQPVTAAEWKAVLRLAGLAVLLLLGGSAPGAAQAARREAKVVNIAEDGSVLTVLRPWEIYGWSYPTRAGIGRYQHSFRKGPVKAAVQSIGGKFVPQACANIARSLASKYSAKQDGPVRAGSKALAGGRVLHFVFSLQPDIDKSPHHAMDGCLYRGESQVYYYLAAVPAKAMSREAFEAEAMDSLRVLGTLKW